jgi:hypothetical protein
MHRDLRDICPNQILNFVGGGLLAFPWAMIPAARHSHLRCYGIIGPLADNPGHRPAAIGPEVTARAQNQLFQLPSLPSRFLKAPMEVAANPSGAH